MTASAQVARFDGDGSIRFERRDLADVAPGTVRLSVTHCGLCGSDKRLLDGGAPQVPGHEVVGMVSAVGPGVSGLAPGTRGAVYIPLYCDDCDACHEGWTNRCANLAQLIGWQVDGGFADVIDLPARNLIVLPDDVPNDLGVLLLDTVGTAAHALRQARRITDGRVLVIGCGPLGLGCVVVATALGSDRVDAVDPVPGRLGAAHAIGAGEADDGPYEIVVEASGSAAGRQRAVETVHPGGVVLMLGESNDPWQMPATPSWRRTDVAYLRTFYFPLRDVPANLDIVRSERDRLETLIDVRAPLDDLQAVFEDFTAGRSLKPLVYVPTPKGTRA